MRAPNKIINLYFIGAINALILSVIIFSLFLPKGKVEEIGLRFNFNEIKLLDFLLSITLGVLIFRLDKLSLKFIVLLSKKYLMDANNERLFYNYGFRNHLKIYSTFYFLGVVIFFSFWEEILFRGVGIYLLTRLLSCSVILSVFITSILFGIYHIPVSKASILPKFLGGLVLGFLFIYTKKIFFPFLSHSIWNILIWREWRKAYLLNSKEFDKIPEGGESWKREK